MSVSRSTFSNFYKALLNYQIFFGSCLRKDLAGKSIFFINFSKKLA